MGKAPDAFRTISEVSALLETPPHVLRFWEKKFTQLKPIKRAGGRRYYRPGDIALLTGIKLLLHDRGVAIRGVQKLLREQGVRHVAGLSQMPWNADFLGTSGLFDLGADLDDPDGELGDLSDEEAEASLGDEDPDGPDPDDEEAAGETDEDPGEADDALIEPGPATVDAAPRDGPTATRASDVQAPVIRSPAVQQPVLPAAEGDQGLAARVLALVAADRDRLRGTAARIAPLVHRLDALRAGMADADR